MKKPHTLENPVPLEASIDVLDLKIGTRNGLKAENIYTIGDLVTKHEVDILKIPNLARTRLSEIKEELAKSGRILRKVV